MVDISKTEILKKLDDIKSLKKSDQQIFKKLSKKYPVFIPFKVINLILSKKYNSLDYDENLVFFTKNGELIYFTHIDFIAAKRSFNAIVAIFFISYGANDDECPAYEFVTDIVIFFELMIQITAIHWSFKFNHEIYEKRCRYPDLCMKRWFTKRVKAQQAKILNCVNYRVLSNMEMDMLSN